MKNINFFLAAVLYSFFSYSATAAVQAHNLPCQQQENDIVAATGSSNLISLKRQLTDRASVTDSLSPQVRSVSVRNNLRLTTAVYN
ncbi:hypothetical protein [Erwinia mallotivora]|uniref:hypothetical protein n=1 Tax=Erwinia mallotivora TaxID=69222 RepID=UPI0021BFD99D|nr:hypothetical protein [Erwinia mallotivora]